MTPRCEPVLRLLADPQVLLDVVGDNDATMLAGPVALACSGEQLDPGTSLSVARALHRHEHTLTPLLREHGVELPSVAPMAPRQASKAAARPRPIVRLRADGRICIEGTDFSMREVCKSIPGARWTDAARWRNPRAPRGHWHVSGSPASAANVLETLGLFDPRVSAGVADLAAEHERSAAARKLFIDGGHIPDDDGTDVVGTSLWSHQRVAMAYAQETSAILLAIPMSGGKTITTIATINKRGCSTVMIFCPNTVRGVWPREVRERSNVGWHIEDGTRPARRGKGRVDLSVAERLERAERVLWDCDCPAPVHAFVANYDVLSEPAWRNWTPPHKIEAIVYDEIHRLKSGPGTQSKAAARLVEFSHFRIGLSGTPIPQSPLDAYGVMRTLDPGIFGGTWTEFKDRYAVMHENRRTGATFPDARRVQNGDELARKFLSITYLPVVDLKLPAVTDTTVEVALEPKARRAYEQLDSELWADLSAFVREGRRTAGEFVERDDEGEPVDGAEISTPNILTRMLRLQQLTGGTLVTDPERDEEDRVISPGQAVRVSTAKADALATLLSDVGCTKAARDGDGAEPVVVFCRFRSDLDAVRGVAEKAGVRYAEVSGRRRDGLNADSRMTDHADVVGVQIQAGGTGVDLTRARYAVWYSLGYSVSDYDQARSRLVRVNQHRPVAFIHLIATDTADIAVYDAIADRRALISSVLRSGSIDPADLGFDEVSPGPRQDSPTGAPISVSVKLPLPGVA